ncbi:response regulator [Algoriphagus halophytocola]|uniref:response regulator n=1 Tax=Algoriphagus halophytocola TaxID=2991499 RepID=UPI0022DD12EF|nr:response regulator [Algoriphagus sp. TR-M9]WBL43043.1 response regulator [Algoriphagus sp. TR-M9]
MKTQILLIDDDPIINFIHARLIRKKYPDASLLAFENGLLGLQHIKSNPENTYLIFLDLNMPKMNGWEFLTAVAKEAAEVDLQVHIVTSSVDPEDKNEAKKHHNVHSYLVKPLKDVDLVHL